MLFQFFAVIGDVPGSQCRHRMFLLRESLQLLQLALGMRTRTCSQIRQKIDHLLRGVRHLGSQ